MVKFYALEELCTDIIDCPHSTPKWLEKGIPIIRNFNISNGQLDLSKPSFVDEKTYKERTKRAQPEAGDLLISREAPMGEVCMIPEGFKCCLGQRLVLLKVDKKVCDSQYLLYALLSKYVQKQIKRIDQTGSIVSNLNISDLKKLIIPIVSDNQTIIGNTLSLFNEKIQNNNRLNKELESMAKTIYDYWFLQFDFPDENGKPYKSSGGKMVWNEKLKREIPERWEVLKFKDCIQHINTGLNPRDNFTLGRGNIKYITVKNLTTEGTLDFSDCDTIDKKSREIVHKRSDVSKGDILFASIAPLGRCFLVQDDPRTWDINESVFSIRPNYKKVTSEYIYMFLMSPVFIKKAEYSSTGSVFSGIRISTLENMNLIVPNKKIMDKFKDNVNDILYAKYRNGIETAELESLRDFLLPLLMNGQVRFE